MSNGRRTPGADSSNTAYDDVPMPEARPRNDKSVGLALPPVWLVVVIAIMVVVGFAVSPMGQRLAGIDLAGLLAPGAETEDETGVSFQDDLDRRLSAAEEAIANVEVQAGRLAAQVAGLDASEQIARLGQSVTDLEEAATAAAGLAPRLSALEETLAAPAPLAPRVDALEAAARNDPVVRDLAAVDERLAALEGAPAPAAEPAVSVARVTELGQRINTLERARGTPNADTVARLAQAGRRIDVLEQASRAAIEPAQLAELAGRLDALEAANPALEGEQVAALAQRLDALAEAAAAVDETTINALELRVGALEAGLIDAAPAAQVRALDAKLGALERTAADAGRSAALAVAVSRLREATQLSTPYAAALGEVRALAGPLGDADLEAAVIAIEARAAAGVPNLEALRQSFADLAVPILREAGLDDDAGWLAKTVSRLSSVVTVRRTGEVIGPGPEARIARAEARLDTGDLAAAIDELEQLEAAPGGPLAGWLDGARARIALNRALDDVSARALVLLGAS